MLRGWTTVVSDREEGGEHKTDSCTPNPQTHGFKQQGDLALYPTPYASLFFNLSHSGEKRERERKTEEREGEQGI